MSMLKKTLAAMCLLAASHIACASAAYANDETPDLKVLITPYAWLTSLSGNITAKGHKAKVDSSFTDLAKHLNFAGMLAVEAVAYDQVGFTGNINVAMLGDKSSVQGASLSSKSSMVLSDLALFYRLGATPLNSDASSYITWDVLAGARIWDLTAKLDVRAGNRKLRVSQHETWADPIVGAKAWVHFSDDWGLELRGDIGGFGAASDLTWSASSLVGYTVGESAKVLAGYRAVGVDYTRGNGSNKFQADVIMHGPIIGLMLRF